MTQIAFGRLADLPPREAWSHEAHAFTPWLAENLDRLSEAIGVELALTGTEVAVESFSADILARNPQDDTLVLIENQLEATDHTHLGQILTYLAGLDAHTVVWIAPQFREPHLSAIRWLNEHTTDGFAFFAVRLRVVRIGDSPFAPVFEVVEKPNGWERRLTRTKAAATGSGEVGGTREAFWAAYAARRPAALSQGLSVPRRLSHYWAPMVGDVVMLSIWTGAGGSGVFLRGGHGAPPDLAAALLEPHAETLSARLAAPFGRAHSWLPRKVGISLGDEAQWDELIDWMEAAREDYARVLREVLEGA